MSANLDAFLDMITYSELGQALIDISDSGYNVIVGSTPEHYYLFNSYADHPRKLVTLGNGLASTAAGAYQILERTYDAYKASLNLPDFSPDSQDAIAEQMIKEAGAMPDIDSGDLYNAILKVAHLWASLPGAQYGQHTNAYGDLQSYYVQAGGTVTRDNT
jgi:muramidase (phage lysozyme)